MNGKISRVKSVPFIAADEIFITTTLSHGSSGKCRVALLFVEVTRWIRCPHISGHLQGAYSETTAADIEEAAGGTLAGEMLFAVAQRVERCVVAIAPDVAEFSLFHIA